MQGAGATPPAASEAQAGGSDEARPGGDFPIEVCGPEARAEQAELFNACFKKRVIADDLAWRYDECPAGPSIALVAREPGGKAVSGYACNPRVAIAGGDEATRAVVGETGDVMTHPDWRKRGIFSRLDRRALELARERGWVLAFGLPNHRSAHIFLELGWERVGIVRPYTFVMRVSRAAARKRLRDGRLAALRVPLDRLLGERALRRLGAALGGHEVRVLPRFPAEVRDLAREVERRSGFALVRDAPYLTWRFLRGRARLHRTVGLFERDGRLAAYATVQLPREDDLTGYLVDALGRTPAERDAAIATALTLLDEAGAATVQATAIDGTEWAAVLTEGGFRPPRPDNHGIVILAPLVPDHPLVAAARDTARWHFTDADRDDETMG